MSCMQGRADAAELSGCSNGVLFRSRFCPEQNRFNLTRHASNTVGHNTLHNGLPISCYHFSILALLLVPFMS
jgi:hypothetical protein